MRKLVSTAIAIAASSLLFAAGAQCRQSPGQPVDVNKPGGPPSPAAGAPASPPTGPTSYASGAASSDSSTATADSSATGTASATSASSDSQGRLPRSGSPIPLIALIGLIAFLAGGVLFHRRKRWSK